MDPKEPTVHRSPTRPWGLHHPPGHLHPGWRLNFEQSSPDLIRGVKEERMLGSVKSPVRAEQTVRLRWPLRHPPIKAYVGPAGSGKTMLALDQSKGVSIDGYEWNSSRAVYWVNAHDALSLEMGLENVALAAGARQRELEAVHDGRMPLEDLVLTLLGKRKNPLLVLDGLDDPTVLAGAQSPSGILRPGVPRHRTTRVLVTSRVVDPAAWGDWITLARRPWQPHHSELLLRQRHGANAGTREQARQLGTRLGHLPLALSIADNSLSAADSFRRGRRRFVEFGFLLGRYSSPTAQAPEEKGWVHPIVASAADAALDELAERTGLSRAGVLLQLLSRFAPAPVPVTVLRPEIIARCALLTDAPRRPRRDDLGPEDEAYTDSEQCRLVTELRVVGLLAGVHAPSSHVELHPAVWEVFRARLDRDSAMAKAALTCVVELLHRQVDGVQPDYRGKDQDELAPW